ncbi:MAG: hypothetical protein Q8Q31_02830 [Nanoarchaeota archaeon]|nr:hypothetical protein [Nanoarchaeota archaeon]
MDKNAKNSKEEKKERKVRNLFYLIAGMIVGLLIVYIIASVFFSNVSNWFGSFDTFQHGPLTFTKDGQQGTTLYHAAYLFTGKDGRKFRYNMYLINDPRKNKVPVEGDLIFGGEKKIFVSLNTSNMLNCSGILRDVSLIPTFFLNNLFEMEHGFSDFEEAKASNLTYLTCESQPNDNVISIEPGTRTKIVREGNCYRVKVANCELLEAAEKFQVQAVTDTVKNRGTLEGGLY